MDNKHQVHNLIILDESGSMETIKKETIQGFNEIVQTIRGVEQQFSEQEHFISLVSFNGLGRKTHLWREPVKHLNELNTSTYRPDASTPLFDAMGISMGKLAAELEGTQAYNVLVTIFTDGEENASIEYSGKLIRKMVENLKDKKWTFTYIGTDHDVDKIAISLSINNVMKFERSGASMKAMFLKESEARMAYSQKIRSNQVTKDDFYQ
ncbi:VWA domain-containing protein [Flavisolibacter sp. BT320]|nr:VWA domain-containing protein [Flavisolibacter longurius]